MVEEFHCELDRVARINVSEGRFHRSPDKTTWLGLGKHHGSFNLFLRSFQVDQNKGGSSGNKYPALVPLTDIFWPPGCSVNTTLRYNHLIMSIWWSCTACLEGTDQHKQCVRLIKVILLLHLLQENTRLFYLLNAPLRSPAGLSNCPSGKSSHEVKTAQLLLKRGQAGRTKGCKTKV